MKSAFHRLRAGAFGCAALAIGANTAGAQVVRPASVPAHTQLTGAGNSFLGRVSGDGRKVAFLSHAPNLVTNDDRGPFLDLFLRDLTAQTTTLVSVNVAGVGGANDNVGR